MSEPAIDPTPPAPGPGEALRGIASLPFLVSCGNWFFRYRDYVFPLVFVALAVLARPAFLLGNRYLDCAVDALGLLVALSGQFLRAAVIGLAYIRRGGKNKQIYASALVQDGFFRHSRNPLYLGNGLVLLGLMLIHGSPVFLLAGGAFYLFAYVAITAAEERFLYGRFGAEYLEYMRAVPRYVPRLAGFRETVQGMSFDLLRVVRKEYNSTFTWVTCALALFLWQDFRNLGAEAARHELGVIVPLFLVAAVLYGVVRTLKKRKLLGHT
ncbi:MAG: S-isoprenylcysteine methyltransferase [Proteobacteria bacterium]|nr:S-isoprenylcysteine methyltransferase [Pseudomonadota bacterium]